MTAEPDWKLKLRYGRLTTPFMHRTILLDGVLQQPEGATRAFMALKVWAEDNDHAINIATDVARRHAFVADGRIYAYDTEPEQPPGETPSAYGLNFTAYTGDPNEEDPD